MIDLKQEVSELRAQLQKCMSNVNAAQSSIPQPTGTLVWSGSMAPPAANVFSSGCELSNGFCSAGSVPPNLVSMGLPPPENYYQSAVTQNTLPENQPQIGRTNFDVGAQGVSRNPRGRPKTLEKNQCRVCNQRGHWANNCPKKRSKSEGQGPKVSVASSKLKSAELYAKAKLNLRSIACLFDSGAEQSIIGRKLVP